MTPDDDFILDRHPQYFNIIIGTGFSGMIISNTTCDNMQKYYTVHGPALQN